MSRMERLEAFLRRPSSTRALAVVSLAIAVVWCQIGVGALGDDSVLVVVALVNIAVLVRQGVVLLRRRPS